MKKYIFCISLTFWAVSVLSQQAERQVILTLQDGESIVYGENSFSLSADQTTYSLVTRQAGNFFIYEYGKRKGPYKELSIDQIPQRQELTNQNCGVFDAADCGKSDPKERYLKQDENYAMIISFKGKTYGPYMAVMEFMTNCEETKFVALVMTRENKFNVINSYGKVLPIDGTASWMKISADAEQAIIAFVKGFDPTNVNMSNFNMEDLNKLSIIDISGAIFGPYDAGTIQQDDFWFSKTGGRHWFLKQDEKIIRDGKPWKTFKSSFSSCDMWVSEDGNTIGISDYGDDLNKGVVGVFPISHALETVVVTKNGKQWIKWICLENNRELVVYQRPL